MRSSPTARRLFTEAGLRVRRLPSKRLRISMDGAYFLFCGAPQNRKGIDSLAQLCREKLDADPFSGCLFIFRSRSAKVDPDIRLRRAGILAGHETIIERTFPVVAHGHGTSENTAGTSGAVAARGRQSGN